MKNIRNYPFLIQAFSIGFWFLVWQLASMAIGQEIVLASPVRMVQSLIVLVQKQDFWLSVAFSLSKIVLGFLLGAVSGLLLAVLAFIQPLAFQLFSPLIRVVKATPVASFTILALMWIPSSNLSVFISFLMILPLMYSNSYEGLQSMDKELLEMAHLFRFSFWQKVQALYTKSLMPYFVSAASAGLGFAWKAGIAAEVIGRPGLSIGSQLYNAKIFLETGDLFAWTFVVIVLSACMEKIMVLGLKRVSQGGRRNN